MVANMGLTGQPSSGIIQACSSSIRTPPQSFGCRNTTGFPWAPILVPPSPRIRSLFVFRLRSAASISSTSMQMWWIPPSLFFSKKPFIGLFSPRGCKSWNKRENVEMNCRFLTRLRNRFNRAACTLQPSLPCTITKRGYLQTASERSIFWDHLSPLAEDRNEFVCTLQIYFYKQKSAANFQFYQYLNHSAEATTLNSHRRTSWALFTGIPKGFDFRSFQFFSAKPYSTSFNSVLNFLVSVSCQLRKRYTLTKWA